jgi:signal transduction histidine kinase/TPR repeat protein
MKIAEADMRSRKYHETTDNIEKITIGLRLSEYYIDQGLYHQAITLSEELLQRALYLPDKTHCIDVCLVAARPFFLQGDYTKAKEYYEKALFYAKTTEDNYRIATVYFRLGEVAFYLTRYYNALDFYFLALKLCETHGFSELLIATYTHIGNLYNDIYKYNYALDYFKKALRLVKATDRVDLIYLTVGQVYINLKDFQLANGYLKRALPRLQKTNDHHDIVLCLIRMTEMNIRTGKYETALRNIGLAYDLANKYHFTNFIHLSSLYYAQAYVGLKDYDRAKKYFIEVAMQLDNIQNKKTIMEFYLKFSEYNYDTHNFEDAYIAHTKYTEIKDICFSDDMMKNISLTTTIYEYEQKKREADIFMHKNVELERYQKIIEEKNQELIHLNDEKDNIMNTISHDLKNYIGSIQMALQFATAKEPTLAENKYIKMSKVSCERSLTLVKDILYNYKLETVEKIGNVEVVDICSLIKSTVDDYTIRANNKDINIEFLIESKPLLIKIDKDKMHRVLENLITNAIKFTHAKGVITISTSTEHSNAIISIKDAGIGIDAKNLPKLFDRFSGVGRKGTAGEESTGLGLFIVKKLVEQHSGTITAYSEVAIGTEFVISFPLVEDL